MNELIKRAAEMLNISATVIRKHIPHVIVEYDDTHCDGVCIADDCEAIAEMICEKEGGALKAERDRIEELEAKLAKVTAAYRLEAMKRDDYSHDAFDKHLAELTGDKDE